MTSIQSNPRSPWGLARPREHSSAVGGGRDAKVPALPSGHSGKRERVSGVPEIPSLRFERRGSGRPHHDSAQVEGAIRHPDNGEPWEYSVMISVRNDRGEEVTRQVVGVGALQPGEQRTFTFAVEVFAPPE